MRLGGLVPAAILLIAVVGCTQSPPSPRAHSGSTAASSTAGSPGTAAAVGVVRGHLLLSGIGGSRVVPGTIVVSGPVSRSVPVSDDGAFSISLPPGSYRFVGHSPRFGRGSCFPYASDPPDAVSVTAGSTAETDVFCPMK